jgi:hypothetical protein
MSRTLTTARDIASSSGRAMPTDRSQRAFTHALKICWGAATYIAQAERYEAVRWANGSVNGDRVIGSETGSVRSGTPLPFARRPRVDHPP